jgi:hypothetical protein
MRGRSKLVFCAVAVTALAWALAPIATGASGAGVTCPSGLPKPLRFSAPAYINQTEAGGEPVSQVAQDGSIVVAAHAGTTHIYKNPNAVPGVTDFALGYYNQTIVWRSTDGGRTWTRIGVLGSVGPHSTTSFGFSDPDFAMDSAGNIYGAEIDLANDAVFSSRDDGQNFGFANPQVFPGDRPWVTALDENVVYLYINSPHELLRSTDGGVTWTLVHSEFSTNFPATGKLLRDPLNPSHGLIGPVGVGGVAISPDDGNTWNAYPGHLGASQQFFGAVAVDNAGWIYAAAAGGYDGTGDTHPNGTVTYNYFNRTTKQWLSTPIALKIPSGDAMWPWIIAGDNGRVAIVWYQNLAAHPDEFYVYAAYTTNGHGSTVTCSDGTKKVIPPKFRVVNASGRMIHKGDICLQGTLCNADPNSDRRLGDFFTVNYDLNGNIFIASGDTMLTNPLGGPKPVANPIFIKEASGDRLLRKPSPAKQTKPPCPFPCVP